MASRHHVNTFFFENDPAGYFEQRELPSTPGRYHYMPYRSVGHYRLMVALKSGQQRCYFVVGDRKLHFTVVQHVSYGLLELADFDK